MGLLILKVGVNGVEIFALNTLYYGEYMNTGSGASTDNRVNWPGFHVLNNADEASPFTVGQLLGYRTYISQSF